MKGCIWERNVLFKTTRVFQREWGFFGFLTCFHLLEVSLKLFGDSGWRELNYSREDLCFYSQEKIVTRMNPQIVVLSEGSQTEYKFQFIWNSRRCTLIYSDRKQISGGQEGRGRREGYKGGLFGGAGFVHYLDQGDSFMGVYIIAELIKLYTLNMCSLSYVNNASIKLLWKEKLGRSGGNWRQETSHHMCWGWGTLGGMMCPAKNTEGTWAVRRTCSWGLSRAQTQVIWRDVTASSSNILNELDHMHHTLMLMASVCGCVCVSVHMCMCVRWGELRKRTCGM